MRLKLKFDSLKETTPTEYASRFLFGGLVTVFAGLIADHYGPVVGGLFLAFPGIFPAGVSLVEKHKVQREALAGKLGTQSARGEASAEAAGGSIGAIGLMGFAVVLWWGLPTHNFPLILFIAVATWMVIAGLFWWARQKM